MTVTDQEAAQFKESLATLEVKTWRVTVRPTPASAAAFLNLPPAQVAGEAMVSNRSDGQVDVYFFL